MKTKYILIILGIIAAIAGILIYMDMTAWSSALTSEADTPENNITTLPSQETGADLEPKGGGVIIPPVQIETTTPVLIQQPVKNPGGSPAPNTDLEATFYPPAD